jgi:integrase
MARTVRDINLETRAARLRLTSRAKPYWRSLERGLHLGYRRLPRSGGTWIARRFIGPGEGYSEKGLGTADDLQDADAVSVLDFRQAQQAAREWWKAQERIAAGVEPVRKGTYTIKDVLAGYEQDYLRRGRKDLTNLRSIIEAHILPSLGTIEATKLTTKRIRDWHLGLATRPKFVRSARGAERKTQSFDRTDAEAVRRRRSRANRILTVLKAALNLAFKEHLLATDEAWRRVEPFRDVDRARIRYLSERECRRLLGVCDESVRSLVRGALLTGARYGELCRLQVADVRLDSGTIHIRESKSGKPRHVPLTEEGLELFAELVADQPDTTPVFRTAGARRWKASEQARPLAAACQHAKIDPPITFHGLRDTYASILAMRGVPLAVIAQALGHADTRTTEKHYAHLAPNFVAQTIRANLPRIGLP